MGTTIIHQCSVKDCQERCSDGPYYVPGIEDPPPKISNGWTWFPNYKDGTGTTYFCPEHALILQALLAGKLRLREILIGENCPDCNGAGNILNSKKKEPQQ